MTDLPRFREKVTIYRKQQVDPATARPYTLAALAKNIGLSADELGHRLRGTGRSPLAQENVRAIVLTLAEWGTLNWDEAIELLVCMDYPLDPPDWQTDLQRVLGPPPRSVLQTITSRVASSGAEPSVPVRRHLFQARGLPSSYVPRPKAFNEIKRLLLAHEENQTTATTTVLHGTGGFGKTTLALALCHDPEIQAAFPDGMLWIELGEQPPRPLDLLNRLLASLKGSHTDAILLQEAQERWRAALQERVCLLVIDDVWQTEALLPLLEGGPQCVRLITTRNELLSPKDATRVLVDAMESHEAISLLCQGLPEDIFLAAYQPQLEALVTRLGCWPLLLTLANGMLIVLIVGYHQSTAEALTTIAQAYQSRGVTAFRLDNVQERQRTVDACLSLSLQHLEQFTHPRYHATERYKELAVFPENTDIPLAILQIYWESAGLEPWETKDLCIRLHRLSLLLDCDLGAGTIRLHEVLRSYLIQRAGSHLSTLHARLLDTCWQKYDLTCWADLPQSETYFWHHLIFHLCQADRQEVLQATLTDLHYLIYKVLYAGISELEADLAVSISELKTDLALASPQSFARASFPPVAELYRYIARFGHLLLQVHTFAEVGEILLNYLPKELATEDQRRVLEGEYARPFLASWYPLPNRVSAMSRLSDIRYFGRALSCAVSPDGRFIVSVYENGDLKIWDAATGAELLTLTRHARLVTSCAVSPDSRFIVSASLDKTLTVWDAATGAEQFTLTGHTDEVNGCAVSPDGRFIVSASYDRTLKVWDAATGAELLTITGHDAPVLRCAVSPDGRFIVSASYDHTLKVWDAATGAERLTLAGHINAVTDCAVSPDGRFIVSTSWDCKMKIWDATSGVCLFTLPGEDELYGCAFHPDREHLVICGALGMYFLRLVS